ncbi:hypothetical protein CAPTEDRAFT_195655 [Capitella teleta]|uniref:G-protein coupled receptors family 1 profile domain-containing protein n=1 Tax=Capitella teleta TaxID=283909 RepID=X1ZVC1_CAPTE|nr:hypothetical protein CAPTEDRAFT_195655 [Capitella teleta]|eukprot:ELT88370.1 hypothetical protein CAPTEDRAFT_195655 [Capitella teleta]
MDFLASSTPASLNYSSDNATSIPTSVPVTRWALLALGLIPIWILTGNLLVLLAVLGHRNLRTLSNYVIASLAVTDFLLALIVVPLGTYQTVRGQWELGLTVCLLWTGSDVFLSTTSILHLSAIAIHRYHGIAHPIRVRSSRDKRHVALLVVPAWIVSFAISLPLIVQGALDNQHVLLGDPVQGYQCGIFDRTFVIYSSLVSFFIPLTVLVFADMRSIQILRRNMKFPLRTKGFTNGKLKPCLETPMEEIRNEPSNVTMATLVEYKPCSDGASEADLMNGSPRGSPNMTPDLPPRRIHHGRRPESSEKSNFAHRTRARSKSMVYISMLASRGAVKLNSRERRAERTLIWVVVSFVALWLPFFITNLTYGICQSCDVPNEVFITFTWLGYLSSGVNPCIYTFLNKDFRNAFKKLLTCRHRELSQRTFVNCA